MTNQALIEEQVLSWDGISVHPHRFGGREYRLGSREIGHLHGNELVDVPLPVKVRDEVIAAGLAERHHILPDSGWISIWLRTPDDVQHALTVLERSLGLARAQAARRAEREATNT
jgi:Family of unknown function (DUF5519)